MMYLSAEYRAGPAQRIDCVRSKGKRGALQVSRRDHGCGHLFSGVEFVVAGPRS
jgi:hypothetical protein